MNDLVVREPGATELARVRYFFRNHMLLPQSRILVAVRRQPVERFVAAAAWWAEGTVIRFQLVTPPGVLPLEAFALLISQITELARLAGGQRLHYADVLPADDPICSGLIEHGFAPMGKNRFFEASYAEAWHRVMRLFEKCRPDIPPDWRTESIRNQPPEIVWNLIGQHHLLAATELHYYWQINSPGGMNLDESSILFAGMQPLGTLLIRSGPDTFYIDVRVVHLANRQLRALGNLMLFHHVTAQRPPGGPIRRLQFHGGEAEHRETANLALRMGGRELPPRHIYAKEV